MNQDTLSNIVNQSEPIEANVSMDLVQLCNTFPYFPIPFILLGKQYSQKKDFRTDATIFQAALRVQSREWLFNYINAENIKKQETPEIISSARSVGSGFPLRNTSRSVSPFTSSITMYELAPSSPESYTATIPG